MAPAELGNDERVSHPIWVDCAVQTELDPLTPCLDRYEVLVPTAVVEEIEAIASYEDVRGQAAATVLDPTDTFTTASVVLDNGFPLDDGENAAVTLANERDAALLLCDEFGRPGLIHASLADTRLVTTPTLLSVLVRTDHLSPPDARALLDRIGDARSWDANSYVRRARSLLAE